MGKVDGVGEGTLIRHSDVSHPLFPGVENLDLRAGEADPSGFWWAKSIRVTLENIDRHDLPVIEKRPFAFVLCPFPRHRDLSRLRFPIAGGVWPVVQDVPVAAWRIAAGNTSGEGNIVVVDDEEALQVGASAPVEEEGSLAQLDRKVASATRAVATAAVGLKGGLARQVARGRSKSRKPVLHLG